MKKPRTKTPEQLAARVLADLGNAPGYLIIDEPVRNVLRDAITEYLFHRLNPEDQRRLIEPRRILENLPPTENEIRALGIFAALANKPNARVYDESQSGFVTPEWPCIKRYNLQTDDYLWIECDDAKLIAEYLSIYPGMANEEAILLAQGKERRTFFPNEMNSVEIP